MMWPELRSRAPESVVEGSPEIFRAFVGDPDLRRLPHMEQLWSPGVGRALVVRVVVIG